MRATLLLCDHAVVAEGKLYISGAGWSVTGPDPAPSAIALKLDVPWDLTNQPIEIRLRLVTEDGAPVLQAGPAGPSPIEVVARLEVGRPVGVPAGSPISPRCRSPPEAATPGCSRSTASTRRTGTSPSRPDRRPRRPAVRPRCLSSGSGAVTVRAQ